MIDCSDARATTCCRVDLGNLIDGGVGIDAASYETSGRRVTANLASDTATGLGADTLVRVEGLVGSPGADVLVGDNGPNRLVGGAGADRCAAALGTIASTPGRAPTPPSAGSTTARWTAATERT